MYGGTARLLTNPLASGTPGRVAILLRLAKAICDLRLEGWDQKVPAKVKQAAKAHYNIKIKRVENVRTRKDV